MSGRVLHGRERDWEKLEQAERRVLRPMWTTDVCEGEREEGRRRRRRRRRRVKTRRRKLLFKLGISINITIVLQESRMICKLNMFKYLLYIYIKYFKINLVLEYVTNRIERWESFSGWSRVFRIFDTIWHWAAVMTVPLTVVSFWYGVGIRIMFCFLPLRP